MERNEALMILVGGMLAIGLSTLPTLTMTIRQIRKTFNANDDYSILIGVFWIYLIQFFASMLALYGFHLFDIFNKGGKYLFMGSDGSLAKFWKITQGTITAETKTEVIGIVSSCIMLKDTFVFVNGFMPLLITLLGFFGGFYSSYQNSKKNRSGTLIPIFWGFTGSFVAYILYFTYSEIARYSLFIDQSLIQMSQDFWK